MPEKIKKSIKLPVNIPFPYVKINPYLYPEDPFYKALNPWRPYELIVKDLEEQGWGRQTITVDQNFPAVRLYPVSKHSIGKVADVLVTVLFMITIRGQENLTKGHKASVAFPLRMRLVDSDGIDISLTTKLAITKAFLPTDSYEMIAKVFYADVSSIKNIGILTDPIIKTDPELYRFKHNIIIEPIHSLRFFAINPDRDIDPRKSQLSIEVDGWGRQNFIATLKPEDLLKQIQEKGQMPKSQDGDKISCKKCVTDQVAKISKNI